MSYELKLPVHAQFNDPESRMAAGCLLPLNLLDEHVLAKISGISAGRAQLIAAYMAQNSRALSKTRSSGELRKYLEKINGIGLKTAQNLVSKVEPRHSHELCNVLIR